MQKLLSRWLAIAVFVASTQLRAGDFETAQEFYERGDYKHAIELWTPLAQQGDARAQSALGDMFRQGKGVGRDFSVARQWYEQSAARGFPEAIYNLARLYRSGQSVEKNLERAAQLMR